MMDKGHKYYDKIGCIDTTSKDLKRKGEAFCYEK